MWLVILLSAPFLNSENRCESVVFRIKAQTDAETDGGTSPKLQILPKSGIIRVWSITTASPSIGAYDNLLE